MFFTARAEYGVRLLVALGHAAAGGQPRSLKDVAEAEALPGAYLEGIAARLRRAGLVEARRGAHGGYRLTREPAEITMDEVVVALEGTLAPMACFGDDPDASARVHCSHLDGAGDPCATRYLWMRVQDGVIRTLQDVTLADLVAFSARPQTDPAPLVAPSLAKELHA
jgi:Rrf2 family protein